MIFSFVVCSICAVLFFGIGIHVRKSKDAVGFFTGVKPPEVNDVGKYNRAVSRLWIIAAVIFEILLGIPSLFIGQNSPAALLLVFGSVAWVFGIIIAYLRIESKYRRS